MTDQGYLSEGNVVWEHLDRVDGDTAMCQHDFQTYVALSETAAPGAAEHDPYQGVVHTEDTYLAGRAGSMRWSSMSAVAVRRGQDSSQSGLC